jgi:hypothetical protein
MAGGFGSACLTQAKRLVIVISSGAYQKEKVAQLRYGGIGVLRNV